MRDQWEKVLLEGSDQADIRRNAILTLNELLENTDEIPGNSIATDLMQRQYRFLKHHPSPEQGRNWLKMKIEDKWNALIQQGKIDDKQAKVVRKEIEVLKKSLYLGEDPELLAAYDPLPESSKTEWVNLLYRDTDVFSLHRLNRLIDFLGDHHFNLPHKEKSRESLIRLKAVADIFGQLEEKTNVVLREVLNGHGK